METKLLTLIIFGLIVQVGTSQATEVSKSNIVGFSSHIKIDKSRPSVKDGKFGRTIQINIWYPAKIETGSSKMFFSDYLGVKGNEMGVNESPQNYSKTVESYFQWPISQGANQLLIDSLVSAKLPMRAVTDGKFKPGKHPVILLIHGSAVDFAFLGESLAEQGYIAINIPVKGYRQKELDVNGIGMETEIRDYEFALSTLSDHPNIALTDIVALGFSFGGQSALGLACRNPNIKTVISFDGGIGSSFGARLIKESPFCRVENIAASLLHIYDSSYERTYLDQIRSFIYADRTLVGLTGIAHWHFTSFGHLASQIPNLFGKNEFAEHGYDTILEIIKGYLNSKSQNPNKIFNLPEDGFDLVGEVEYLRPVKRK
ncbi:acyl-CoA thioester hydrolase/BAAT C-terminal domain-containing protein [Flavobacteriaceae bacterium 3-367]